MRLSIKNVSSQAYIQQWEQGFVAMITGDPLWSIASFASVLILLRLRITLCGSSGAAGSARNDQKAIIGIFSFCQEALRPAHGVTALV